MAAKKTPAAASDGAEPKAPTQTTLPAPTVADPTATTNAFDQLGIHGLRQWGGHIDEEWHPKLRDGKDLKVFAEMRANDPTVGFGFTLMESWMRRAGLKLVVPEGRVNPSARKWLEWFQGALRDVEEWTLATYLEEFFSALHQGHALWEIVLKVRKGAQPGEDEHGNPLPTSKFSDGKTGLHRLGFRAQETITHWEITKSGTILGAWQQGPNQDAEVFLPDGKLVRVKLRGLRNNPRGVGLLRNGFVPYHFISKLLVIEAMGHERECVGTPIVEAPEEMTLTSASAEQKRQVAQVLESASQLRRDTNSAILIPAPLSRDGKPSGWAVRPFPSSGAPRQNIRETIRDHQKDLAMSLLTELGFIGMDKVGTQSVADNKKDTLGLALEALLGIACTGLQKLLDLLASLNGCPEEDVPQVSHGEIVVPSMMELATFIGGMIDRGVIRPDPKLEAFVREKGALPPADTAGTLEGGATTALDRIPLHIKTLLEARALAEQQGNSAVAAQLDAKITQLLDAKITQLLDSM